MPSGRKLCEDLGRRMLMKSVEDTENACSTTQDQTIYVFC